MSMTFTELDLDFIKNAPKTWHGDDGRFFVQYQFQFDRDLSNDEKSQITRHYLDGLKQLDTESIVGIQSFDFSEAQRCALTFHESTIDRNRVLFALYVGLKDKFPNMEWTWW